MRDRHLRVERNMRREVVKVLSSKQGGKVSDSNEKGNVDEREGDCSERVIIVCALPLTQEKVGLGDSSLN
jgi:hypothetical protein